MWVCVMGGSSVIDERPEARRSVGKRPIARVLSTRFGRYIKAAVVDILRLATLVTDQAIRHTLMTV